MTIIPRDSGGKRLAASPEKTRPSFLWPLSALANALTFPMFRLYFRGGEHLPRTGPFVLVANHYSEIDPIVVALGVWKLGRAPRFLAKASLFKNPVLRFILKNSGQIPVERNVGRGNDSLAQAKGLVEKGQGVVVYPEGTLTRDPDLWPMRGKSGAVRLALAGDIPVIPMAQWGTQKVMARYSKKISFFPPKRIDLLLGEPIDLSAYAGKEQSAAALNEATDLVMARIAELLGELRGETPPAERWDPSKHHQSETGKFE